MRLITVRTPEGAGRQVADLAFSTGIKEVSISGTRTFYATEASEARDVVEIETATPLARRFIAALTTASFYDPQSYSFVVRHPEAIFGAEPPRKEVHPIVRPATDVYEELYQYIKVTWSLAGRVFFSSLLLSFGMVEDNLPLIIAGLLFLPYHHYMLGVALGARLREWRFLREALTALLMATMLIFLAGVCVAVVTEPPIEFELKGSPLSGAVLALIIGGAAAIASVDDAGRRELIGLAATSHITIYPAWFGLQVVFGLSGEPKAMDHLFGFFINVTTLTFAALVTYSIVGLHGEGIRRFIRGLAGKDRP